jgi:hypothetical protein
MGAQQPKLIPKKRRFYADAEEGWDAMTASASASV